MPSSRMQPRHLRSTGAGSPGSISRSVPRNRLDALLRASIQSEGLADVIKFRIEIAPEIARGPSGKAARVKNVLGPPPGRRMAEAARVLSRDYSPGE